MVDSKVSLVIVLVTCSQKRNVSVQENQRNVVHVSLFDSNSRIGVAFSILRDVERRHVQHHPMFK